MAVIILFVTSLIFGWNAALPLVDKVDEKSVNIDLSPMIASTDEEIGDRLAKWTPDSEVNPETLGSNSQVDILIPQDLTRNGKRGSTARWPNATVPYVIEGLFDEDLLTEIQNAFLEYKNYTCVRFVPRSYEADYIAIVNISTGCWAKIGRVGGRQTVNLSGECKRSVLHELTHAVGFDHEQCRDDRDDWVIINYDNIIPARMHNFNQNRGGLESFGVPYDYNSVMHYKKDAFSSNKLDTIVNKLPLGSIQLGQLKGFSWGDVFKINRMYNCTGYPGYPRVDL